VTLKKFILVSCLFCLNAYSQVNVIAECITPDNYSGGVTLFTNAEKLIIQVARVDEGNDEFIVNQGPVTQVPLDLDQMLSDLDKGIERSIAATKVDSTEVEGKISPAALFSLKLPLAGKTQTKINAAISRRGQFMYLICNRPSRG
jgi:hypothetical protein